MRSSCAKGLFWRNEKGAKEVDFLLRIGDHVIPVEVNSADYVGLDSLNEYMKQYRPAWSIRISEKNFGFENGIKSVPLYAAFCVSPG